MPRSAVAADRRLAGRHPRRCGPGVEIRLKPGWHTSGAIPAMSACRRASTFPSSQNVKAVDVLWPAPQRISGAGLESRSDTPSDVILPIVVVPQDSEKPVTLRLKLDYAVCEKLCVPAQGNAEFMLTAGPSSRDAALADARIAGAEKTCTRRRLRARGPIGPARSECAGPRVIVDIAMPAGANVDLFAEGPTPTGRCRFPSRCGSGRSGLAAFRLRSRRRAPGPSYEGALITVTAVAGADAIEVTAPLD